MSNSWHSVIYKRLKRFFQDISFGVSLGFRIYFASFLILFITAGSMIYFYYHQQKQARISQSILDLRVTSMEAAQKIKESVVAYDNTIFRFVATRSDYELGQSEELRRTALLELDRLNMLTNNPAINSRLIKLRSRLRSYFNEANELVIFAKANTTPPALTLFQAATWARTQGLQREELSALSAAGNEKLESVFAICDELLTYNRARLAESREEIENALNDSQRFGKIFLVLACGSTILVSMALAISLVGPLRILMTGVKKMESGNQEIELPVTTSTEIGQLTMAFNRMARTIHGQKERLLRETITDDLTGVYNKRYFSRRVEEEFARSIRAEEPLSLLMIDVDHFKKYNDTMGHEMGNVVLKRVSSVIEENLRNIDLMFRYGGDEFVAILPNQDPHEAGIIALRLTEAIRNTRFPGQKMADLKQLTLSIGGATYPHNATSLGDLIEKADQALYQVKGNGRDNFTWAESPQKASLL